MPHKITGTDVRKQLLSNCRSTITQLILARPTISAFYLKTHLDLNQWSRKCHGNLQFSTLVLVIVKGATISACGVMLR